MNPQFFILLFVALVFGLYIFEMGRMTRGWVRYPEFKTGSSVTKTGISVVIAFRNESKNLPAVLNALENQQYPLECHEVIFIDDYSEDQSGDMAREFCRNHPNFRYFHNEGREPGKKSALKTGICNASFELIATTDADCLMGENWISTINDFYLKTQADMIIGLVDIIPNKGFFNRFQEVEFLSLVAAGAGAAALDRPIFCNAANLIFRKSLFHELKDPFKETVPSGDDTFFLHKASEKRKKICLLKSIEAVVFTNGHDKWSSYLHQRLRWVSKSRYYRDLYTIYLAVLVLSVNLLIIASLLPAGWKLMLFPVLFGIKTSMDYLFLKAFMRYYGKPLHFPLFAIYSFIYPFTVLLFAVGGLSGNYVWKGRKAGKKINYQART